ncbi:sialidase family protein [Methylohalobius crimeensis]|uniref:sialidase family protein n=1 Tax=Methylohalobius crimeensis TaxID=244365 RepID=UPI0004192C3D|nr:sialidase family protein [Methylohalobius crimeensis]
MVVSTAFAPDGRLWRVIAGHNHVYVDHSEDKGQNFSNPVPINPEPRAIRATSEDRPAIAIDESGRIMVIYAVAGSSIPWIVYYSTSRDGGRHFSPPQRIVPHARVKTYQAKLGAAENTFYLFWHQGKAASQTGSSLHGAVLSDLSSPPQGRIVADRQCECCRIALAFDSARRPVLMTRFVYPGVIRDHGLIFPSEPESPVIRRVSFDEWHLEACPEHGPALAIGPRDRVHMVWFTQGRNRQGLFYTRSDDRGKAVSDPLPIGNPGALAGHPDLLARGRQVVLVWQEFDGRRTRVKMIRSRDRGRTWSTARVLTASQEAADYPFLLAWKDKIYLSWNTEADYRLIPISE